MSKPVSILVTIIVALLAVCVCVFVLLGGLGFWGYQEFARNISTTVGVVVTPVPTSTGDRDLLTEMRDIEAQVAAIRNLTMPEDAFSRSLQSSADLRERIMADFEEEYSREEAADDALVLHLFGMLPRDYDLFEMYVNLYSGGIAGYYDPDEKALFVISDVEHLDAAGRATYAHEYLHALQDYHFDLRGMGFSEEGWEADSERAAALQALIEGEAILVESIWRENYFTQADYNSYLWLQLQQLDNEIFQNTPAWVLQSLFFPYDAGFQFALAIYERGGFDAINEAFANPPASLEQIIHPEKYFAGELPIVVPPFDTAAILGTGWEELDSGVNGEWFINLILAEHTPTEATFSPANVAAGWGGDYYSVAYNREDDALAAAWLIVWDNANEASMFVTAVQLDYGPTRFGQSPIIQSNQMCWTTVDLGIHCLLHNADQTLWVVAPNSAQLEALVVDLDLGF